MKKHKLTLLDHILIRIFYELDRCRKTAGLVDPPQSGKKHGIEILSTWARRGLKREPFKIGEERYEKNLPDVLWLLKALVGVVSVALGVAYALTLLTRNTYLITLTPFVALLAQPILSYLVLGLARRVPPIRNMPIKFVKGLPETMIDKGTKISKVRIRLWLAIMGAFFWLATWGMLELCQSMGSQKGYVWDPERTIEWRLRTVNSPFLFGIPLPNLPKAYRINDRDLVRADKGKLTVCRELCPKYSGDLAISVAGSRDRSCFEPDEALYVFLKNEASSYFGDEHGNRLQQGAVPDDTLQRILSSSVTFNGDNRKVLLLRDCFQPLDDVEPSPHPFFQYRKGMVIYWGLFPRLILVLVWFVRDRLALRQLYKELQKPPFSELLERLNTRSQETIDRSHGTGNGKKGRDLSPIPVTGGAGNALVYYGDKGALPSIQSLEEKIQGKPFQHVAEGDASSGAVRKGFLGHCAERGKPYEAIYLAVRLGTTPGSSTHDFVTGLLSVSESVVVVLCDIDQFDQERGGAAVETRKCLWREQLPECGNRVQWLEVR